MSQRTIAEQIKRFCAYQERSHYEVKNKLCALGARGEEIDELFLDLIQNNFLNEERFACAYAGGKFRMKQWGKQKIIQGLKKHQVSDYCIKRALQQIDDSDYQHALKSIFEKKLATLQRDKNQYSRMNKMKNYLIQKGYSFEDIQPLLQYI